MEEHPPARRSASAARGVALALAAVVAVGLLVRSPATTTGPTPSTPSATEAAPAPPATSREDRVGHLGGTWSTVGSRAPLTQLTPAPGVWTSPRSRGHELVVGFAPDVAAYDPAQRAWRSLPVHPDEPLEVRGAVASGRAVYVYGAKPCPGCPWEGWLHRLDVVGGSWERLPDAPGEAEQDDADVVLAGDVVIVVRDRGTGTPQALAFDPAAETWSDLALPDVGPLRWQAIGAGRRLVVVGVRTDGGTPVALVHDPATGWIDASAGIPLTDPDQAAAVATPQGEVILHGSSTRDGGARGAVLTTDDGTWQPLPDPHADALLGEEPIGPLNGLSGAWDGQRALFAGGLPTARLLAWSPAEQRWDVGLPPAPRAGATAVWSGRQLLLWGGVDRNGPSLELQVWPVRPGS